MVMSHSCANGGGARAGGYAGWEEKAALSKHDEKLVRWRRWIGGRAAGTSPSRRSSELSSNHCLFSLVIIIAPVMRGPILPVHRVESFCPGVWQFVDFGFYAQVARSKCSVTNLSLSPKELNVWLLGCKLCLSILPVL